MMLATLSFTLMVVLVKIARVELSSVEIVFWRSLAAVPLAYTLAARVGVRVAKPRLVLGRALLGFITMLATFTAAGGLPVANLTLITKLQPILVAILAPIVLGIGERSGLTTRIALGMGVLGCAVIVAPEIEAGSWYGAVALFAAFTSACAHVCVRALGVSVHPYAQVFWLQAGVLVLSLLALLATGGIPLPPTHLLPHLVGIGVLATVGQWLMTHGYRKDRAASVAAASYTGPIWAVVVDALVFSVLPGAYTVGGGLLVMVAGLLLVFASDRATPAARADP